MFIQRFCILAMFLLSFVALPATTHANDYTYTVADGAATIISYNGSGGDVVFPDTLDGYPVKNIGSGESVLYFLVNPYVTCITIPDSVTNINPNAFLSSCVTNVVFGNGVVSIGRQAFAYSGKLNHLIFPNQVNYIGERAFAGTSLKSVMIGDGVSCLGYLAFYNCPYLTSVNFLGNAPLQDESFLSSDKITFYRLAEATGWPDVPAAWGSYYSRHPTALWEAYFTLHLSTGGDFIYWTCKYKQLVFISANEPAAGKTFVSWIGDTQYVASATSAMTTVTMPSQDISIMPLYRDAFTYATNADYTVTVTKYIAADGHVTIPDTVGGLPVTCIGASAFSGCASLTNITVTANVTNIGEGAFAFCPQLERIDFFGNAPCFSPDTEIFYESNVTVYHLQGATGWDATYSGRPTAVISPYQFISNNGQITVTKYLSGIVGETVVIPGTINGLPVRYIGQDAFKYCTNIASVVFPDSVTEINEAAFAYCRGLTNITFGSGIGHIGRYAFLECNSLASVTIPESVSVVDVYAFSDTGLTSVRIPDRVNTLGQGAFRYCSCLTNVTIGAGVANIENFTFAACGNLVTVSMPDTVEHIGRVAFGGDVKLANLVLPEELIDIGECAFQACNLTSIRFFDHVTTIDQWAFSFCYNLTNIIFGSKVAYIGESAFAQTAVVNIVLPDSVVSIEKGGFYGCTRLFSVTMSDNLCTLGPGVFAGCNALLQITIPPRVTAVESIAFADCTSLTRVSIPNGVTSIGDCAFSNCTSLTAVTIPATVTSIGGVSETASVQPQNRSLATRIAPPRTTLSTSVTTNAGNKAFCLCSSLTAVYCKGNAPSVDPDIFLGANNVVVYYLPGTTGWEPTLGGRPTVLWNSHVSTAGKGVGGRADEFGFRISGTSNLAVIVEACTNLANPAWQTLEKGALVDGTFDFNDSLCTNYPARFYRINMP